MGFVRTLSNGTGANTLCVNAILNHNEAIALSNISHLYTMENNAPFMHGVQPVILPTKNGKIVVSESKHTIINWNKQFFGSKIKALTITQPSEIGTYYTHNELKEVRRLCDDLNLKLHIDGAWLAYSLANINSTLEDFIKFMKPTSIYISGTKTGTLNSDICVFEKEISEEKTISLQKQLGQFTTKTWFSGIQFNELFLGENSLFNKISVKTYQNLNYILELLSNKKSIHLLKEENYSFKISFTINSTDIERLSNITCRKINLENGSYKVIFMICDNDISQLSEVFKNID